MLCVWNSRKAVGKFRTWCLSVLVVFCVNNVKCITLTLLQLVSLVRPIIKVIHALFVHFFAELSGHMVEYMIVSSQKLLQQGVHLTPRCNVFILCIHQFEQQEKKWPRFKCQIETQKALANVFGISAASRFRHEKTTWLIYKHTKRCPTRWKLLNRRGLRFSIS